MPAYPLSGRVALVTGAQRGIGLETARTLQRRGARVALVDLDQAATEASAATLGGGALGLGADVTDRAAMDAAVAGTVKRFGALDVVVANAGIAPTPATARVMDDAMFERVIEVDLLERRAARVILPRRWIPLSVLRGLLNPLIDEAATKRRDVGDLLRALDTPS